MRIVSWLWFWYMVIGFILGGGAVYLWIKLKTLTIKFHWYEWIMTIFGFLLFLFMGQTFVASFVEDQPQAAWLSLLFFGFPIVLLGVGTYRSIKPRLSK